MRWDFQFELTVSRGRKRLFAVQEWLPALKKLQERHHLIVRGCYRKTKYPTQQAALNCEWFKKNKTLSYPHYAYLCDVCDGWHIATDKEKNVCR